MPCCLASSTEDVNGTAMKDGQPVMLPKKDRSCTDFLFVLLYIASLVGLIVLISTSGGDPERVIYGADIAGRVCGRDVGVEQLPYAAWPYIPLSYNASVLEEAFGFQICVPDCNSTSNSPFMHTQYASSAYLHYCLPSGISFPFASSFQGVVQSGARTMADLWTSCYVIIGCTFMGILFSWLFLAAIRLLGGAMVWFSLVIGAVAGFLSSYALLKKATEVSSGVLSDRAIAMDAMGWCLAAATTIFCLLVFALRKRIQLGVAVVKESAHAMNKIRYVVLWPTFGPLALGLMYMVLWTATTISIFTSYSEQVVSLPSWAPISATSYLGQYVSATNATLPVQNDTAMMLQGTLNSGYQASFAFTFGQMLWTLQAIQYLSFTVVAWVVAKWYFTGPHEPEPSVRAGTSIRSDGTRVLHSLEQVTTGLTAHSRPGPSVRAGVAVVLCNHLGTVLFGALIIAIIQFVRAILYYVEKHTKSKSNRLQACLFAALQCCLSCVQCICDKLNKNALVWTAIRGEGLVTSAYHSFQLIFANLARAMTLNLVSSYLVLVGKWLVALLTTGMAGIILYTSYGINTNQHVESIIMPMVLVFLISYLSAGLILGVLETTADTIFICFLLDEQSNKEGAASRAPRQLMQLMSQQASNETGQGKGGESSQPVAPTKETMSE